MAACLAPLAFWGAHAEDAADAARAATRRTAASVITSSRQKTGNADTNAPTTVSRATTQTGAAPAVRERAADTSPRGNAVVIRTENRAASTGVAARTAAGVQSRAAQTNSTTARTAASRPSATVSRTATTSPATAPRAATRTATSRTATTSRTPSRAATTSRAGATQIARSAALTREDVISKNYSKCREVYYDCMDEFCANKDAQLRRCACSSRANEFDKYKRQLSDVEEKMLDFNQRLLTVNMDKEDADALFKATEGEQAFNQKDTSASKKMLDEIAKKLNTSFDSSNFDTNLSSLSWSLNADAAFDSVDSMLGASTTGKSGTALYSAALPVCRQMAQEVCSEDELAIAESGYQMTIEQDCNTVAKSYQTQTDQAREKLREGGALLDMSRLDIYQKRNSDDILTCKKKMLDMLTDSSVCGTDLTKCLDTSGRYIDPSTGEAFLTVELANLANLIKRPDAGQTWTTAPGNDTFVSFLNSKKKFLAPAMENCQDISDYVWDEFIEDALAQIKLAQDAKLETMRQSCTTLTTQCLSETAKSLADFDARALSTFGVDANKTVNAMCADVRMACTALLESTGGGADEWIGGMTEIATDTTYETIMQTCREVGRACIIQACKSISGNFGLCENIQTSVNRKSIINRSACWNEVKNCVDSAGEEAISNIMAQLDERGLLDAGTNSFYGQLYGKTPPPEITNAPQTTYAESDTTQSCELRPLRDENGKVIAMNCVHDICTTECQQPNSHQCKVCRLSESLWGNCEVSSDKQLNSAGSHNRIRTPVDSSTSTLLSWFAVNTGTQNRDDSCRDTSCGIGFVSSIDSNGALVCVPDSMISKGDGQACSADYEKINSNPPALFHNYYLENCCIKADGTAGELDSMGNCCVNGTIDINLNISETDYFGDLKSGESMKFCVPANADKRNMHFVASYYYTPSTTNKSRNYLYCLSDTAPHGTENATTEDANYPSGKTVQCDGQYILFSIGSGSSRYLTPPTSTNPQTSNPLLSFQYKPKSANGEQNTCKITAEKAKTGDAWKFIATGCPTNLNILLPIKWMVDYSPVAE